MTPSASQRGKRNRNAGNGAERELVRWLKAEGIDAVTTRNAGGGTQSQRGDVFLPDAPNVVIEVKNTAATAVWTWLDQLDAECVGMDDPVKLLAWRTCPRPEHWVWLTECWTDSLRGDVAFLVSEVTTSFMKDCAGAIRLGHCDVTDIIRQPHDWAVIDGHEALRVIRGDIRP